MRAREQVIYPLANKRMNMKQSKSDKKSLLAAALIIIGRIGLFVAIPLILFALVFGYPIEPLRVGLGIITAYLLLLVAGYLIEAYLWIIDILVQSIAIGFLILGATIIRLYFASSPHSVSPDKVVVLMVSIVVFILSVFWLQRKKRTRRMTKNCKAG